MQMDEKGVKPYKRGKIYKIESKDGSLTYYGSTTEKYLRNRLCKHKDNFKRWKDGINNRVTSFDIFDYCEEADIFLVEDFPCDSKDELRARERYYITQYNCVNKQIPTRTRKEYYEDNKQHEKVNMKKYYDENKHNILEQHSEVIKCECGKNYTRGNRKRHTQSKFHLNVERGKFQTYFVILCFAQ